jgi:hypothetical protein
LEIRRSFGRVRKFLCRRERLPSPGERKHPGRGQVPAIGHTRKQLFEDIVDIMMRQGSESLAAKSRPPRVLRTVRRLDRPSNRLLNSEGARGHFLFAMAKGSGDADIGD